MDATTPPTMKSRRRLGNWMLQKEAVAVDFRRQIAAAARERSRDTPKANVVRELARLAAAAARRPPAAHAARRRSAAARAAGAPRARGTFRITRDNTTTKGEDNDSGSRSDVTRGRAYRA